MKVVAAVDSFKGSLDSLGAGQAIAAGVLAVDPGVDVRVVAIADGGEGTLAALLAANEGRLCKAPAVDARGKPIVAEYGVFERAGQRRAVLECARTVGIDLVQVDDSLPLRGTSLGMGQQLVHALAGGVQEVLVTLGGSATTDGGTGVFQALGAQLFDADGAPIGTDENPVWRFASLDVSGMRFPEDVRLSILSDVTNPLCGDRGAAAVFGPQKGATPEQVEHLDGQLARWAAALAEQLGRPVAEVAGAGAAGGLGAAFLALGGQLEPGFDRVAAEVGLADVVDEAYLVFTGEGSLDAQSAHGKVPSGVARIARASGAIVVGVAGRIARPLGEISELLDGAFPIHSQLRPLTEALDRSVTAAELEATACEVTRLVLAARDRGAIGGRRGTSG